MRTSFLTIAIAGLFCGGLFLNVRAEYKLPADRQIPSTVSGIK